MSVSELNDLDYTQGHEGALWISYVSWFWC
jgi:hypothetical protein